MKKKRLAAYCAVCIAAVIVFCSIFGDNNFLVSGVRTAFSPVLTLISGAAHEIKNMQIYFTSIKSYKEQNDALAEENAQLKAAALSATEYKSENERLSELLDMKGEMENRFETVAAKVVSYEPNNWYDTIVINKGTWSGIKAGDAVIAPGGVVGRVTQAGAGYSVISTILSSENSVAVRIIRCGLLSVVEGDAALSKQKKCRMSFIDDTGEIKLGDTLETTGAGGIYPEGISVGTVKEIKAENSVPYAVVEPSVDLSELYEVMVIVTGDGK